MLKCRETLGNLSSLLEFALPPKIFSDKMPLQFLIGMGTGPEVGGLPSMRLGTDPAEFKFTPRSRTTTPLTAVLNPAGPPCLNFVSTVLCHKSEKGLMSLKPYHL